MSQAYTSMEKIHRELDRLRYDIQRERVTVKALKRHSARLHNVSYKTTVRAPGGGFVLPVYRPTSPDRQRWLQLTLGNA